MPHRAASRPGTSVVDPLPPHSLPPLACSGLCANTSNAEGGWRSLSPQQLRAGGKLARAVATFFVDQGSVACSSGAKGPTVIATSIADGCIQVSAQLAGLHCRTLPRLAACQPWRRRVMRASTAAHPCLLLTQVVAGQNFEVEVLASYLCVKNGVKSEIAKDITATASLALDSKHYTIAKAVSA